MPAPVAAAVAAEDVSSAIDRELDRRGVVAERSGVPLLGRHRRRTAVHVARVDAAVHTVPVG